MFRPDDVVKFVYTGEEATVLAILPDGMLRVRLAADRDEIPAFPDDLVLARDFKGLKPTEGPAKKPKAPKKEGPIRHASTAGSFFFSDEELAEIERKYGDAPEPKNSQPKESALDDTLHDAQFEVTGAPYHFAPNSGLHVALQRQPDGSFVVHLVNDSQASVKFDFSLVGNGERLQQMSHIISPMDHFPIGNFGMGQLNHQLSIDIRLPSTQFQKSIKIKPRQAIVQRAGIPLANFSAALFLVTESPAKPASNSLQEYSKSIKPEKPSSESNLVAIHDVHRRAHFPIDLDLHIEKIVPDPRAVKPADTLKLQLKKAEQYLFDAMEAGVPQVFLIHGLGNGRLKEEISRLLDDTDGVVSYKNEYHHKYGFGATEVILG